MVWLTYIHFLVDKILQSLTQMELWLPYPQPGDVFTNPGSSRSLLRWRYQCALVASEMLPIALLCESATVTTARVSTRQRSSRKVSGAGKRVANFNFLRLWFRANKYTIYMKKMYSNIIYDQKCFRRIWKNTSVRFTRYWGTGELYWMCGAGIEVQEGSLRSRTAQLA